jgi:hypothetical protein
LDHLMIVLDAVQKANIRHVDAFTKTAKQK